MQYEYISWNRFYRLCGALWKRIADSGYRPDLLIAITRGGYPAARVLADFGGLMDLVSLKIEHYHGPSKLREALVPYPLPLSVGGRRVLLVDDISDSGDTFDAAFAELDKRGEPLSIRTAVLHYKQVSRHTPDYYAKRIVKWRWVTYPWALVEDLTEILTRSEFTPESPAALARHLADDIGIQVPKSVIAQMAPIILKRLANGDQAAAR